MDQTKEIIITVAKESTTNQKALQTLAVVRGVFLVATAYVMFLTACKKYKNALAEDIKVSVNKEESTEN